MDDRPSLFVSAGDPSGDNAASRLLVHLKESTINFQLFGLGGDRLRKLGQVQLADSSDLAVLGFWEVAKQYFFFRSLFKRCLREIKSRRPKIVLLVDYPGFNLRLAAKVKRLGIPVLYYITPQVWAWGKGRVEQIRKNVDRVLTILPFEKEFFAKHNIASDFVGHYLLEDIQSEFIGSQPPPSEAAMVALLPGSRRQEVERMLPQMAIAGQKFTEKYGTKVLVAGVKAVDEQFSYRACLQRSGADRVEVVFDDSRRLLFECSLAVVASGTATLEAGIIGRPMVIIYKTGGLTYQIAKRLVKLPMIGLINLVLNERVVPELIQAEASAEKIFAEIEKLWLDSANYEIVAEKLRSVKDRLGGEGSSLRAAAIVKEYLQ